MKTLVTLVALFASTAVCANDDTSLRELIQSTERGRQSYLKGISYAIRSERHSIAADRLSIELRKVKEAKYFVPKLMGDLRWTDFRVRVGEVGKLPRYVNFDMNKDGFTGVIPTPKGVENIFFVLTGLPQGTTLETAEHYTNGIFAVKGLKSGRVELELHPKSAEFLELVESGEDLKEAPRQWTSKAGTTIKAVFVGYSKGTVSLQREGQEQTTSVHIKQLSSKDQRYIRSLLASR